MTETIIGSKVAETISYKSFSPAGDLVATLPSMRQIFRETGKKAVILGRLGVQGNFYEGAIHSTHDEEGVPVCMSQKHWDMLTPLLEAQKYVDRCEVWKDQEFHFDLDRIREFGGTPMPHYSLYHWQSLIYPQLATDFSERFIDVSGPFSVKIVYRDGRVLYSGNKNNLLRDKIIICRSERYINQYVTYHFLKPYQTSLVFTGTRKEYDRFCKEWDLDIPYLEVNNFLELAQAISRCGLCISNQTLVAHIANGVGKKRLLELSPNVPNVIPTTKHGYVYLHQVSLQYYFEKHKPF